ncbi:MAG: ABC transporter ATP-binding protein [Neomegalonema sp.]|nr:ABC transporter ATP-binding protein [Neomegalonema sp.]
MSNTEFAIEIEALRKTYAAQAGQPAKQALKGVDLRIPAGSIYGLLGPNGAGKSTMINILAGLVTKTSGSVRIWGFDQDVNPRMARASIGVVPQELNIDPFLSPLQSLEVQAGLYGVPKSERHSRALLAALGLADKADAYARTLSGGMRRRLLVAKAMVHSPPVLVLDEPTAGVDIELRRQLWDFVRDLNARGVTIILTTHYLEEAEEMCDRIAIIHQGALRAEAPTAELLGALDGKTLRVECAAPPPALAQLQAALPQASVSQLADSAILEVSFRQGVLDAGAILHALLGAGVQIHDVTTRQADLEDVFLYLTQDEDASEAAMAVKAAP